MAEPRGIDPRGPRFAASVTAVLLLGATFLALLGISTQQPAAASFGWFAYQPLSAESLRPTFGPWVLPFAPLSARLLDPGFLAVLVLALLFLWGVASPRTAPWGVLYRRLVQPRLAPPTELEDPRPPRFAQGVGLFVTVVGLVLHLAGVPWALPIAAAMAFMAAFLNAVFGLCLGCQLWLLLQRVGLVGRAA
ncbi:DUF4395 domain-containing protein [Microbacterium sp. EYE_5]|uniref:DUF4395 domain-containing protein n=1 Tax=unclassified Microbacterium TaxID=2609290 RepID=UPI002003C6C1|nr:MULTISPECIES: DUF4395 domain-containing protein [unclassified Microbacterium]MCK6081847.1 DUF4395 domain-containing protein [Microbacterium sp. EYE_382]MCK6087117.1 DUF4395 domain-containing protein [Microbacterium sp. EYE_384]MCK6124905.1 DUF4395 domain-containing protein [Microbacterium sp. EYE_80]MCK6127880.1 DUF4395 domain-containing protein [Microbacterium sp. EYE_79]MCK6142801.1 DUF4395 domain-containing protein [Microbacterium sp. EYE_39]